MLKSTHIEKARVLLRVILSNKKKCIEKNQEPKQYGNIRASITEKTKHKHIQQNTHTMPCLMKNERVKK